MMVGWGGSAPIIVNRCTNAAALTPAFDAGVVLLVAGAAEEGALFVSVAGDAAGVSVVVSCCVSVGVSIVVVGAGVGTVTGATDVAGADMGETGLTGDSGLDGFVTDLVHESLVRFHCPQTAEP